MKLSEERQLSQVALGDVIEECRRICQQAVLQVQESVLSALEDAGINYSNHLGLDEALCSMPDPFEGLDSAYLRENFTRSTLITWLVYACRKLRTCVCYY